MLQAQVAHYKKPGVMDPPARNAFEDSLWPVKLTAKSADAVFDDYALEGLEGIKDPRAKKRGRKRDRAAGSAP